MKNFLLLLIIFTLAFTACDDDTGNGSENNDIIGTWTDSNNEVTLEIGHGIYGGEFDFVTGSINHSGNWYRNGSILTLYGFSTISFSGTAILTQGDLNLNATYRDNNWNSIQNSWYLSREGSTTNASRLIVQNQSSYQLHNLAWSGQTSISIAPSFSDIFRITGAGSGYLFLTIFNGTTPIECRTFAIINLSAGENSTLILLNTTLVVALNDPANTPRTIQSIAGQ